MERDDGWVGIRLEGFNNLHFIPSTETRQNFKEECKFAAAHSDLTRAAVVDVFDLWTSLTAIFCLDRLTTDSELEVDFGRHSQTLPQFPNPI